LPGIKKAKAEIIRPVWKALLKLKIMSSVKHSHGVNVNSGLRLQQREFVIMPPVRQDLIILRIG